jgi:hypothetical protein
MSVAESGPTSYETAAAAAAAAHICTMVNKHI